MKVEIEIPEGKKAKWVNGILTLVDEEPKDITDRIKTFTDACSALGDNHPLVSQYYRAIAAFKYEPMTEDLLAYLKLRIICEALNEGWKPKFNSDECRYYPWFYLYSKYEYEKLNEDEKNSCAASCSYSKSNANVSHLYAGASGSASVSNSIRSSRLALKTRELAEYCSKQFINIWCNYLFG